MTAAFIIALVLFLLAVIRVQVVHTAVNKRIEEVFASKYWYMYAVDVDGTYARGLWDFRKWTYKHFFPDEVPK